MNIKDLKNIVDQELSNSAYSKKEQNEIGYLVLNKVLNSPLLAGKYKDLVLSDGFYKESDISFVFKDYNSVQNCISPINNNFELIEQDGRYSLVPIIKDKDIENYLNIKDVIERSDSFYELVENFDNYFENNKQQLHQIESELFSIYKYFKDLRHHSVDSSYGTDIQKLVEIYPFSVIGNYSSVYRFGSLFSSSESIKGSLSEQDSLLQVIADIDGTSINKNKLESMNDSDFNSVTLLSILLQDKNKLDIFMDVIQQHYESYKTSTLNFLSVKMLQITQEELLAEYPIVNKIFDLIIEKYPYINNDPIDFVKTSKYLSSYDNEFNSKNFNLDKLPNGLGIAQRLDGNNFQTNLEDHNFNTFRFIKSNSMDVLSHFYGIYECNKNNDIKIASIKDYKLVKYLDDESENKFAIEFLTFLKDNNMALSLVGVKMKRSFYEIIEKANQSVDIIIIESSKSNKGLKEHLVHDLPLNYNEFLAAQKEIDTLPEELSDDSVIENIISKYKTSKNKLKT